MHRDTTAPEPNYYRASAEAESFPPLGAPTAAKICIVGGGLAGLNVALGLAERGCTDVVLLEGGRLGHGASGRNGGFVFGGFSRDEESLLRVLGPQRARSLYHGTLAGVERIRERIRRHGIDCDYVPGGVIWANWFRDPRVLRERRERLAAHYGVEWEWLSTAELRRRVGSERYQGGLLEPGGFHMHPLRYLLGLARAASAAGVRLHEHSPAIALERRASGWRVHAGGSWVEAEQVVLACGGYLGRLHPAVDAAVLPIATFVMVTEPLGGRLADVLATRAAVYDTRFAFDYYRPLPDTRLLWGGRISVWDRAPTTVQRLLRRDMRRVFPNLAAVNIDYAWSGLMSYARHQMPQVGSLGDGLWFAQAFGGHGLAPTTFAGELLAAALAEGDTRWQAFRPFGLASAHKPAGYVAAQLSYWWAQGRDACKDRWEDWRRLPAPS